MFPRAVIAAHPQVKIDDADILENTRVTSKSKLDTIFTLVEAEYNAALSTTTALSYYVFEIKCLLLLPLLISLPNIYLWGGLMD